MQRLYLLYIFIFWISFSTVNAQNTKCDIIGSIFEEGTDFPVEQATVRLLNPKDSSMIRGVASSKNGSFTLKGVRKGKYLLNISFIGFKPLYKDIQISGKKDKVYVGKLYMLDESIALAEAVVVGKAPEVIVRNDTTEYNADSYKVTEGSVLEDLLKKMPGVEVDSEGKVTVNGKEITKIMVDGKEFFSNDPKVASKNLPAKMIDKVQVLDKKSDMAKLTGFDDGEEETVINLTVKPGMKQGWFGNAYAGYGSKDRYEGNAMVNRFYGNDQITIMGGLNNTNNMGFSDMASTMFSGMRGGRRGSAGNGITTSGNGGVNFSKEFNKDMILGGNANYSHSENDASSKSKSQTFLTGDSISYSDSEVKNNTRNNNAGMNLRMEWKPDTMTNIIFTPDFGYSNSQTSNYQYTNTRINEDTLNISNSNVFSDGEGYNLNARLEMSRKLNNKGRVLSFSFSGGTSDSYNNEINYSETDYLQEMRKQIIDQHIRYDNKSFNYRAYVSWVEPLGRNNFLQATYSFSQKKQESLKNAYNKNAEGEYNVLDTASSKNYRNNFINQRVSLSFKAQREKYMYMFGINLDPSYSQSENFIGDSVLSNISRNVTNLSPIFRFNYRFDKRTNLRIDYNGRTSQPSMTQMQPVIDNSNPLNIIIGNPELKPRYTNNFIAHFNKFNPQKQSAMMFMLNGNYILNDIVSKTVFNSETGGQQTTYENVNGNFTVNGRIMFNTPLKNKKFTINTMTTAMMSGSNSFVNGEKNRSKNLNLSERAGIDFRSSLMDIGVNGNVRYNSNINSLQAQNNLRTFNYSVGGYTTLYLPWNIKVESDINWSTNSGYADGFELNEVLWNASVSKSFLKNNQGTLRFKIYDILQQRSNISRSVTASRISDSEYNTLSSYFMFHFIYRFSIFKGGQPGGRDKGPDGRPRPLPPHLGGPGPGGPGHPGR